MILEAEGTVVMEISVIMVILQSLRDGGKMTLVAMK